MKKQLLIAAVAATMTSVAMADISITGSAKANYLNTDSATEASDTNTFSSEINLGIKGTNGGSGVVVNLQSKNQADQADGTATSRGFDIQDSYITSSVADVNVQVGSWRGSHNLLEDGDTTTANKFKASTTIGGVTVTVEDGSSTAATGESIKLSGDVAGVSISHKMSNDGAGTDTADTSISGSFSGVNAAYRSIDKDGSNNDKESFEISTTVSGMTLTYASIDVEGADADVTNANAIDTDGFFGDYEDVASADGFGVKTSVAGNTVQLKSYSIFDEANTTEDDYTKVVVTRPLASGATFEATYTDQDAAAGSTSDKKTLDLELAVKF